MAAVGQAFLSAALQVILDKLASPILREFGSRFGVDKDLKKLTRTLSKVQAVLNDAEERQINDMAVKLWLTDLKEVAYDADDVLDEVATEAFRINYRDINNKVSSNLFSSSKDFLFKVGLAPKIKDINTRLEEIAKEKDELGLREGSGTKLTEIRDMERSQTSSLIDEACIFGRESNKEEIVELIISEFCGNDVGVIPIVGMGGLGKTTLAQLVHNDGKVTNHFEYRIWVCVSDDFNLRRLTKSVLESITRNSSDLMDLDILQINLRDKLKGMRFLLVLDDVWNEKKSDWDVFRLPFKAGAAGSKIIVTTRSEKVASIMGTIPPYRLEGLSDVHCWSLFKARAFLNGNSDAYPYLVPLGEEIVKKCKGLPLAVKTLAGLLYSKTEAYEWDMILKSDLWDLEEDENEILPALRLSYSHLPAHLKQCFIYCSIFPKDHLFGRENLVLLWMAEGFVHSKGRKRLEDVASDYFDDLLLRSFFQHSKFGYSKFVMHDLIHDLAKFEAGGTCFVLQSEKSQDVSEKVRHSSVLVNTFKMVPPFDVFHRATSLRTMLLLPCDKHSHHVIPNVKVPFDLLADLSRLRSLDLSHVAMEVLPDSVGNLRHLRYLDLSSSYIKMLPESISALCNLQTLILIDCNKLHELPRGTKDLVNLRHLNLTRCWVLTSMPLLIGKLTSLQRLDRFVIGKAIGCGIDELKDLNELRDTFCIDGLENVVKITEAKEANLKQKQYLRKLVLRWIGRRYIKDGNDEDLLECLQPNANLRELEIDVYHGVKFPNWMGDSSFSHLEKIKFSECNYCKILPPLGQLPFLKHLIIDTMYELESIGNIFYGEGRIKGFPSLEKLELEDLKNLKEWQEAEHGDFPLLKELTISSCPNLANLPKFPSLCELELDECHETILSSVNFLTSLSSLQISNFQRVASLLEGLFHPLKALKELKIQHLYRLSQLQEEVGLQDLDSLQRLEILCCQKLISFPEKVFPSKLQCLSIRLCSELNSLPKGMQNLSSLEELYISSCPKLVSFPEGKLPNSLKTVKICSCASFISLPTDLHELPNLEYLGIYFCQKLETLPEKGLPASLHRLSISGSELLQKRCEEGGEDWPKIAHIPNIWVHF